MRLAGGAGYPAPMAIQTEGILNHRNERLVIATMGNVVIQLCRGTLHLEDMPALRRAAVANNRTWGERTKSLVLMESEAVGRIEPGVREAAEALLREVPTAAIAYVIEGSGFRVATARTILAGLTMLTRRGMQTKTCDSLVAGTRWLCETIPTPEAGVEAAALARFTESLRGAGAPSR